MIERHVIGLTFRVAVEGFGIDAETLRRSLQNLVDRELDGRRWLAVEVALDACERIVQNGKSDVEPLIQALDNDTTVSVESSPTLKTEAYRVICESSRSERGGYELATRKTFPTFEDAEQYASGISDSLHPLIVAEVERASR